MAFVKLDTGILRSTLWFDRDCREVFITALLMAEPFESTDPMPQIEVDTLNLTGFIIEPGWYGMVPAAGVGIIHQAGVDPAAGIEALRKLGAEDPESRSPENGGRRMVRVPGGYLILNYMKYRDKDHTTAERSRRYRDRLKSKASHRDVTPSHRDITQADADADADAES